MTEENKEGLYGNPVNLKAQNARVIIVTAITAILVLGITAWGIIYAVGGEGNDAAANDNAETTELATNDDKAASNKESGSSDQNESNSTSDEKNNTSDKKDSEEDNTSNVIEVTDINSGEATAVDDTAASENIPHTGPEDILPLALVLGLFTVFVGSAKLAKVEA